MRKINETNQFSQEIVSEIDNKYLIYIKNFCEAENKNKKRSVREIGNAYQKKE